MIIGQAIHRIGENQRREIVPDGFVAIPRETLEDFVSTRHPRDTFGISGKGLSQTQGEADRYPFALSTQYS